MWHLMLKVISAELGGKLANLTIDVLRMIRGEQERGCIYGGYLMMVMAAIVKR